MKTDAEITRIAAEKVMGWPTFPMYDDTGKFVDGYDEAPAPKLIENVAKRWIAHYDDGSVEDWQPLTDWRAAGEIVEKMRAAGWNYRINESGCWFHRLPTLQEFVHTAKVPSGDCESPNAPRAITIAALRALGVEI